MKIMWITGVSIAADTFSDSLREINISGGWIYSTLQELKKQSGIEQLFILSIAPTHTNEKKVQGKLISYQLKGDIYKIFKQSKLLYEIKDIISTEQPDLIDVQGIEFDFSTMLSKQKDISCSIVYTLQGLVSEVWLNIKNFNHIYSLILQRSLYDNMKFHGTLEHLCMLSLRGKRSIKLLKKAKYITGRTDYDKHVVLKYNQQLQYFSINRNLRSDFYEIENWNLKNVQRHSIFTTQITTILKGGHLLLEIIDILVKRYPDLIIYIPGEIIDQKNSKYQKGYEKYLLKQIKIKKLEKNICFTGRLTSYQLIKYLEKSHVFLQTSLFENSSNALAEAQIIGTPCIASDVGGTNSYIEHNITGMLYNPNYIHEAVESIIKIFENDEIAYKISFQGQSEAKKRHDRQKNIENLIKMYKKIISGGTK